MTTLLSLKNLFRAASSMAFLCGHRQAASGMLKDILESSGTEYA